jgi:hypothetical protein
MSWGGGAGAKSDEGGHKRTFSIHYIFTLQANITCYTERENTKRGKVGSHGRCMHRITEGKGRG